VKSAGDDGTGPAAGIAVAIGTAVTGAGVAVTTMVRVTVVVPHPESTAIRRSREDVRMRVIMTARLKAGRVLW
jgi:hypothetical protein